MSHFKNYILGVALIFLSAFFIFGYLAFEFVDYPENREMRSVFWGLGQCSLLVSVLFFSFFSILNKFNPVVKIGLVLSVIYLGINIYYMDYVFTYTGSAFYIRNYYSWTLIVGILVFAAGVFMFLIKCWKICQNDGSS